MPLSESPSRKALYLWQQPGWPDLRVNATALAPALESARMEQGRLLGVLDAIGLLPAQEVARDLWVQEALATAQIEGQRLDMETVRSSVARRLGLDDAMPGAADRSVEGLVDVMQDAVAHCAAPLDADRLWRWQSALFPGGTSGIRRIAVGRWRAHEDPMQIVSGTLGACRAWSVDSENWPQRAQFLPDLQPNSRAIGQKDGEKWAAADNLQPTTSKSDRLLDATEMWAAAIRRSAETAL